MDFTNMQISQMDAEINQVVNKKEKRVTKDVEIFSALINGQDTSKYGSAVDDTIAKVKKLGDIAVNGNVTQQLQAKAELNAVREQSINVPLQARLSLVNGLGEVTTVGYDEKLEVTYNELQGELSRMQASSGSFTFPTAVKRTQTVSTQTATGGVAIDYREYASGAIDAMGYANEEVIKSIFNQYVRAQIDKIKSIKDLTTLKNYKAGATESNIDAVVKLARGFGKTTILGDYDMISELNGLQTFGVNSGKTEWRVPESVMDEIVKAGIVSMYKGSQVIEIPNTYDMTKLTSDGTFFAKALDNDYLLVIPQGMMSPLKTVRRGGLVSMTGQDINTRQQIIRYDLEFGNMLIDSLVPALGLITKA